MQISTSAAYPDGVIAGEHAMPSRKHTLIIASIALGFTAACGPSGGAAFKDLPPEKSLDCAASIYAVINEMDPKAANPDIEFVKSNGLAAITHYGTIYGEAEGFAGQDVVGVVKLKAYRMTGKVPGGSRVSASTIIERAKACLTPEAA
jgi:hypothetical protein